MMKKIVRIVLFVLLLSLFSVYGSIEPRMPGEKIVLAKNTIIMESVMTPSLGYDWTNELPYKMENPYKGNDEITTYHDLEAYLNQTEDYSWPLEWPSRDDGVKFLPLGRIEDRNQMFIPIEPLESKYEFLRDSFTKGSQ